MVDFDKSGAPLRVAGTVLDITRQKEDEAEILKLRKGIEQSPAMVVITDNEGRFEYINPKFTEVTGYSFEEIKGKKPSILKSGKNSNEFYKTLWNTIVSGEIWQGELINRKKNGELYWEFQSITPVKNSKNEITNFLSIKEDITERKKLTAELIKAKEDADQASKAKGDFLATMSHEIRTPMNGVIGTTSLLLRTPLSEEQLDYVKTIRNSGDALLTIINDILDYSKIESGKMLFENQPFDLRLCIDEVLELFSATANQKGLTLLSSIDPRINSQFLGDITRIRQVLVNLVGNALKFTSAGWVEIIVKKDEISAGTSSLLISVRDTGIGIPADKLSGLFQPFTQADTSTSRKFGGTGLGLAITARLVELMGGTISATSELNKGSEFAFELKLMSANIPDIFAAENELAGRKIFFNLADDLLKRTLEAYCKLLRIEIGDNINECDFSITKNISSQTGLHVIVISKNPEEPVNIGETTIPVKVQAFITILKKTQSEKNSNHQTFINEENLVLQYPLSLLVAEDNSINQKIMNKSLKSYGYSADFAANGLEVLEALKRQPYDIIFMDIQMPEMDGLEATQQIRELKTQHRPVIIAMTANAMQEDRQKCSNAGMDDYVSKPLKVEQVGDIIRKWGKILTEQKNE
ncbi:MAG TPA: ATP-binding protein [Bacteroidales bacterium]|nr:ATP-binding protein [Bacteroidales bacterium]